MRERFNNVLREAIRKADSLQSSSGHAQSTRDQVARSIANSVFDTWYHSAADPGGGSYYFLFRKNSYVTNISFAELAALLRLHIRPINSGGRLGIQFLSSAQLKETFYELLSSFWALDKGWDEFLSERCYSLFSSVVRYDSFYNSVIVHLPRNMVIDLFSICSEAGFVHSCGETIYARHIEKAQKSVLMHKLETFLNQSLEVGERAFFVPYSHQHFSDWDAKEVTVRQELKNGLSDVKLHLDKYYFDGQPLPQVLREIVDAEEIRGRLSMPRGVRHYQLERREFSKTPAAQSDVTIFALMDCSIEQETEFPGADKYYIFYAQRYKNSNPLLYFDEEKPAWIAPVTLPHNLAAAMINISRPYVSNASHFSICDPFLGTGTTLLEALKITACSSFVGSDQHPLTELLVGDNAEFFSADGQELDRLSGRIDRLVRALEDRQLTDEQTWSDYEWAKDQVEKVIMQDSEEDSAYPRSLQDYQLPPGLQETLEGVDFWEKRILFYLIWRAAIKNWYLLGTREDGFDNAIVVELKKLYGSINRFRRLRGDRLSKSDTKSFFIGYQGTYSVECTVDSSSFSMWYERCNVESADSVRFLQDKKSHFDVIITDPPYGFNVDVGDRSELAKLYANVIPAMIDALTDEGQLLFCLPDEAKTGQIIPSFVMKQIVAQEVLLAAERADREVIRTAQKRPHRRSNFEPPYYWQSERALKRSILHFRFRRRAEH